MEAKAKSCYKCGQEGHIVRLRRSSPLSFTQALLLFSPVTAPTTLEAILVDTLLEVLLVPSAIAAARLATLPVRALRLRLAVVEAITAVATVPSVEANRGLGAFRFYWLVINSG